MSRPHDRQLISNTFAIDDSFMERTLMFQNGDWLVTSFNATNAQNVPVFFHSINKEDFILDHGSLLNPRAIVDLLIFPW